MKEQESGHFINIVGGASENGIDDYLRRLGTAAIVREAVAGIRPWIIGSTVTITVIYLPRGLFG